MGASPEEVVETFETATEENRLSALRQFQVVHLPPDGEVLVPGDMHDHRTNFAKLVRFADLANNPKRHIILHELIHGDHFDPNGAEDSWRTLHQAAELKSKFSSQVHFMLANHDLAQIQGEGIMKSGLSVCEAFTAGVKRDFAEHGDAVSFAISEFLLSLPLAIRTTSGIFMCHSLPTDRQVEAFDFTVFDRDLNGADYVRKTGPVYQLIWGRNMTPATAEFFAGKVGASMLITGHQPQEMGVGINGDKHLIVASEHNQGAFLHLDLATTYDMPSLIRRVRKFAALDV